jgi:ABC-type multidrug transport system fused ATPase/permease subunit
LSDSTTAVDAALVLTSFIEITFRAQFVMRQSVLLEQQMTSVERIFEYGQLDSEAPLDTNLHNDKLECDSQGAIEFRNVWLKYAKTKNYILKDMSFVIDYNEKVSSILLPFLP